MSNDNKYDLVQPGLSLGSLRMMVGRYASERYGWKNGVDEVWLNGWVEDALGRLSYAIKNGDLALNPTLPANNIDNFCRMVGFLDEVVRDANNHQEE